MKYRRAVGGIAALATVVSGSALALAAPSYAGTMSGPSFLPKKPDSTIKVLEGSDGDVTGIAAKGSAIKLPNGSSESPKTAARTHLQNFAGKLGVDPAQMRTVKAQKVDGGNTVRMQQYINGVPVVAGELVASLDKQNNLEALLGKTAKGSVQAPKKTKLFSVGASRAVARSYVAKKAEVSAAKLEVKSEGRWIYNPSLLGAPGAPVNRETQKFQVNTPDHAVDYTVFVDSGFHTVALAVSNNHAALKRDICDLNNKDAGDLEGAVCDGSTNKYTRREGQAKSGIADVDKVYDNLGVVSKWYASYAGLDVSAFIGGDSKTLKASTRTCLSQLQPGCPLANAFWSDGIQQMVYGDGVTGLDVTGHELTHGVTSHTSALYYAYQSGAINESISDTMGELIDLAANPGKATSDQGWLIGEDEKPASPDLPAPLRSMKDPTKFDQPDRLTSSMWAADAQFRDSGGVHTNSGPGNKTAYLLTQGDTFNGYTIRGVGLAKAFKIYWTAENLMTSGTDYKDLFNVLPLSCRKNIGKTGTYITEDDCAQVDKAVRATELYKDPANAAPVATPYCTAGNVKTSYVQTFDTTPSDWSMAGGAGLTKADLGFDYVNTGKDALGLFTQPAYSPYPAVTSSTATSNQKTIPAGSWLRIDYATLFSLYQPSSGTTAKLEYDDGSGIWRNANTLPGSVNPGSWTKHDSHGWASAKYNLLTLAGKKVKFRISASGLSSDGQASVMDVDNFKIYTCS